MTRRLGFGGRLYRYDVVSSHEYDDGMALDDYLAFLYERFVEMHRLLTETGSLYVHLDFRTVHHARLVLDEIFGPDRLINEIIWAYDYGGRPRDRWPRKHDNILWYAKSDRWVFNREEIDRIPYMAPGLVGPGEGGPGQAPDGHVVDDDRSHAGRERTGYPTQKPVALVERIVRASSQPGGPRCRLLLRQRHDRRGRPSCRADVICSSTAVPRPSASRKNGSAGGPGDRRGVPAVS